ncbi:Ribonuclease P protein subunit p30 [Acipenser ruthenus]|uniref:Ribonuclease P protein subunit p30 n=1 Tax=Acipenser ruthenus TaxID=7906 RepID=A0A444UII4_ACIRT|nr:Ribonuclease P protein subunit p30 [Acipenser ruthenus]
MALFGDLNIVNTTDKRKLKNVIETAAHLGYSTVAINHVVNLQEKKQGKSKPIKIITRLTVVVSEASHCNELRTTSPRTRLYDLVAVHPKTEKLFHTACMTLDVDIIEIIMTEKQQFHFRRPPVNVAIDRGIVFELVYSPAIKDSTMRRYTISNSLSLMNIGKGKNIIISSGAEKVSVACIEMSI